MEDDQEVKETRLGGKNRGGGKVKKNPTHFLSMVHLTFIRFAKRRVEKTKIQHV